MRFDPAEDIEIFSATEREVLQNTLPPGTLPAMHPFVSPPNLGPSVEDFLRMDPNNPMRNGDPQQEDSSQTEPHAPNDQEKAALKFTFGEQVGEDLSNIIEIGQAGEATEGKTLISVNEGYDPDNLDMLADFIYEATRVWQQRTGRHTGEGGGMHYDYKQLYNVDRLNTWQHASAVEDWFYVKYGIETGAVDAGETPAIFERLWQKTLKILNIDLKYRCKFGSYVRGGHAGALLNIIDNHYGCVIKELRETNIIQ